MSKLLNDLILLFNFNLILMVSGQLTIDQSDLSTELNEIIIDNDHKDPTKPEWIKIYQLLTSQLTYNLIIIILTQINNGFITLPLAIGLSGLMVGLIALIVALQANWKVSKYDYKLAERRRREKEIEEVHLKIYEQVIYGDKCDLNCSGRSMDKLLNNKTFYS